MTKTIFMIHGMWGGAWYWANYRSVFEAQGYRCIATTLPYHDMDPKAIPDPRLGTTGLLDYVDTLEIEIKMLAEKPIIMGHSMGGLLAQMLAARGLASAVVLLTPAAPAGILALKPSVIRSFWSVITTWGFWKRPIPTTFDEAVYSSLHLVPEPQQKEIFDQLVHESGRVIFEIGFWPMDLRHAARVDARKVSCPMLVISGREDRIVPASVVRQVAKKYAHVATYREFANHAHWVVGEPGWEDIARYVGDWMAELPQNDGPDHGRVRVIMSGIHSVAPNPGMVTSVHQEAKLREISDLPGPRQIPVLGNLHQITPAQLHQNIEAWHEKYGACFRIKLGMTTMLVISDHEVINALLRDRPDGFQRSSVIAVIGAEMGLPQGVFTAEGADWQRQRRMVMAGFNPTHVKAYYPSLLKVTQRLRGRWQRAAAADASIELQPDLMRFTVDAIAGLAFGGEVNTLESDEEVIQQHLDKIFPMLFKRILSIMPWWRIVRLPADRQLERSVTAVNLAVDGFIKQARERLAQEPTRRANPPNLLEAMIVAADEEDSGITDREVAGNVLTMLLAGEDTTANTLAWMIYLLQRNPEALHRAQAEARALAGDSAGFTHEQMGSLRYLEACAHETMRLKPVAPFNVIEALRETVVGDVRVPKGMSVWCIMRGDSMSEKNVSNPAAFEPQRWLADANADSAAGSAKRVSMPFGAGPRICPGRYLALLEIKMAMAMLLNHFDIEDVTTPDGRDAVEKMAFTMTPVGLRMKLRTHDFKPGANPSQIHGN